LPFASVPKSFLVSIFNAGTPVFYWKLWDTISALRIKIDRKKLANRLELEDSPYLQQHKNNPVDWYPWGDEALQKAFKEEKPLFLSIGYSSCHWCHVMERESFENEKVAQILNEHFVSIKIDREERPDLDKHYQDLYQMVHRKGGGWPLSIFLSHDRKPFHIDTYIPETQRYNKVGMLELLPAIVGEWSERRDELLKNSDRIDTLSKTLSPNEKRDIDDGFADLFIKSVKNSFDSRFGGFSQSPKFPQVGILKTLQLLESWEMVEKSLNEMVKGGFYDLIDGGFCRYSVDERWLVPHFEKMAYDNGLLMEIFANAYIKRKNPLYKRVAEESAKFMLHKMESENLFYSASDADSEGEEGKYFVYKHSELLEKIDYKTLQALSITPLGNFENDQSIVRVENHEEHTKEFHILKKLREDRTYPAIDRKILTSWNSMVIKGLLRISIFDERYLSIAENSLNTLLEKMFIDGNLYHSRLISNEPKILGFLEDYAYLSDALIELYQRTLKDEYLQLIEEIISLTVEKFYRKDRWFATEMGRDFLVEAEAEDTSYPSSRSKMVNALLSGAVLLDRADWWAVAEDTISRSYKNYPRYPQAFSTLAEAIWRYKKELLVIKSSEENLKNLDIDSPVVFKKVSEDSGYDICGVGLCYQKVETAEEVYKFIDGFFI
jgi:uncharacterized protein YyaL (SSP411 family)